jgi:hypothetical protein
MRVVQGTNGEPEWHNPVAAEPAASLVREILEPTEQKPPALPSALGGAGLTRSVPAKEMKTTEELASMILDDLSQIEGCPKRGVRVTVYGSNPWNSWLSFGSEAGPVPNKVDLQGFCDIITERLKRLYVVST